MRRGGASRRIMCDEGMYLFRCVMIVDCMCIVSVGVRACLCFVCLASFVRVAMTTMSVFLNVMFLIVLRVCGSVNVCWGLIV